MGNSLNLHAHEFTLEIILHAKSRNGSFLESTTETHVTANSSQIQSPMSSRWTISDYTVTLTAVKYLSLLSGKVWNTKHSTNDSLDMTLDTSGGALEGFGFVKITYQLTDRTQSQGEF